jgi:AcrR family transcriptional regulator
MTTQTTRRHILDAANKIIQREGVAHLTIEAVAKEAGISKGGVLYHFPSKDALVEGMIAFYVEGFTNGLSKAFDSDTAEVGRWSRAYIRASSSTEEMPEEVAAITGLIAAIATNPQLLEPLREHYDLWQKQAENDNLPPTTATILRLAVDGLWLADMLGFAPPKGKFREEVIHAMLAMTRFPQEEPGKEEI